MILMDKARLLPNGDLLAIYAAAGDTPWGYGMVKMDRDSKVIWSYLAPHPPRFRHRAGRPHPGADQRIHLRRHRRPWQGRQAVPRGFRRDALARRQGAEEGLGDPRLAKSRYKLLRLAIPSYGLGDPLHTNSVQYITAEQTKNFPFAKEATCCCRSAT
jgi:hypothetical protein